MAETPPRPFGISYISSIQYNDLLIFVYSEINPHRRKGTGIFFLEVDLLKLRCWLDFEFSFFNRDLDPVAVAVAAVPVVNSTYQTN